MAEHLFLRACRRQSVPRTPIWMMRQAGRYLPAYRAVRARASFLDLCRNPDLACEVTLQPIDEYGFDAAILFSDILITLPPMGVDVAFPEAGPKIGTPVRTAADCPQATACLTARSHGRLAIRALNSAPVVSVEPSST